MDIKELFDIIYNKYKNNDDVMDYAIFDNKTCLSIDCMTEYNYGRIEVCFEAIIVSDKYMNLFVKDEISTYKENNYLHLYDCDINNTDLIFNTIDIILNNYSIEALKNIGFNDN